MRYCRKYRVSDAQRARKDAEEALIQGCPHAHNYTAAGQRFIIICPGYYRLLCKKKEDGIMAGGERSDDEGRVREGLKAVAEKLHE